MSAMLNDVKRQTNVDTLPTDEERRMLRDSTRGYLEQHWPLENAVERAEDLREAGKVWRGLASQGLATIGSNPEEGGLREVLVVMEELGRAACPAPMLGAALANIASRDLIADAPEMAALTGALHAGEAAIAFAFGGFDGDANAGSVRAAEGTLTGRLSFVEGAVGATHLLVITDEMSLAIVRNGAAGLELKPTPGLSVPSLAQLEFSATPAVLLPLTEQQAQDLNRIARLALVARALGAANRGFELVVGYAKERHQFGQPIGKFQAIQHKLANCLTSLEGVRQTLWNAATCYDRGTIDWRLFASAAYAFASPALRQVSLETHHTFGAIGYAEEHEAPRHFRRTHADLSRFGGPMRAREELARYLVDENGSLPEYDLGAAGNAFRAEVRAWLKDHWGPERRAAEKKLPFSERGFNKEFSRTLGRKGWLGLHWPKQFGGQARTPLEQFAFQEEMSLAGAPTSAHSCATNLQAPGLMKFGTPEQQDFFLPKMLAGEVTFCLGYSEPGSGSDLASLKTTAVRDGDDWIINGQKIWTTLGEKAEFVWLAVRTDLHVKPAHAGISVFAVRLDSPGITIRPSMAMYGHTFCNVFYDDVRVPGSALIGEVNQGWKVLTAALADERMLMGASVVDIRKAFGELVNIVRQSAKKNDPVVRDRIGALAAEIEVARRFVMHGVSMAEQQKVPMAEAAISKHFSGELMERLGETAIDLAGAGVTLSEGAEGALSDGVIEQMLRRSIMMVVGGGTAEIQRTLIALRGLGLPR